MTADPDIRAGRLDPATLERNFDDVRPPLGRHAGLIEASRCYFCHDAPCVEACPTGIDIPGFIRSIQTGNLKGAAVTILEANIMGGMCARDCPVEELCERACVRNTAEDRPIAIGALQRHATDWLFERGLQPFERAPSTGRRVAVVGAGPAGLSCAHRLALLGHDVVVFEARPKGGGLNEYGIAAYKATGGFAQRELDFILSVGGIELRCGQALGRDVFLADLQRDYDAVFLGLGHTAVNGLALEGETMEGVLNAVDAIAALRQAADLAALPVGRRVVVIGGGNTAIDIATQMKLLGAEEVTLVYRRGPEQMPATAKERDWAQHNGVRIKFWAHPRRLIGWPRRGRLHVREVEFEYTRLDGHGRLHGTGESFTLRADEVFKAVGQLFMPSALANEVEPLEIVNGRIAVNEERQTSLHGVFAGGDCVEGIDLTVRAVEDGKRAARGIDQLLRG